MGIFIDKRLDARYERISLAMQSRPSVIIRQLAQNRSEEIAYGRFLNNRFVNDRKMIQSACEHTSQASSGRDILLVQDTSTMGFGLYSPIKGLSSIGDGRGRGFFLHPVISLDAQTGHCLGLASAKHYDREEYPVDKAQRKRDRNRQGLDQKESYRWYEEVAHAVKYGNGLANSYTVVADREADIYELFTALSDLEVGFVIRSFQNRRLKDDSFSNLQQALDAKAVQGQYDLAVPATDKRSAHLATLEVKWTPIELARPRSGTGTKHLVDSQAVMVVDVRENPNSVVGKEKPIHWRLLTSHEVQNMSDALRIIGYYVWRWTIEQLFRTLKKKGLDIGSAQVENAHALKNLSALSLISAVRVMQLVQARNQPQGLQIKAAFQAEERQIIWQLNPKLEGNTEKQKNPHPPSSMAFAAWVIARLGGWSGYASQRPPGPITMWNGLKKLHNIIEGARWLNSSP